MEQQVYDQVDPGMALRFGFQIGVFTGRPLSDRLEVPEEWQGFQHYEDRLAAVLQALRAALGGPAKVVKPETPLARFAATLPSNLTGQPEQIPLVAKFDGTDILVDL